MRTTLLPLLAAAALTLAACGNDTVTTTGPGSGGSSSTTTTTTTVPDDANAAALAEARARWAEHGPASYRLTLTELCFCPETVWVDTVVDGEIVTHEPGSPDALFDPGPRAMEDLFDRVAAAIEAGYAAMDLSFDDDTGALERFWVDVDELMADEENGVDVAIGPVDGSDGTALDGFELQTLTEPWGCGYGFAAGSPDQTASLVISWGGGFGAGPPLEPVQFPEDRWVAEISVGTDLFANWCDDVVEPDEPTPVVEATAPLTGGLLTFTAPVDRAPEGCADAVVEATLTGATIDGPDGTPVELGSIDLTNSAWGCFAG